MRCHVHVKIGECFTSCIKVVMKYLPEQQKRTGGERDDSEADKGEERGGGVVQT